MGPSCVQYSAQYLLHYILPSLHPQHKSTYTISSTLLDTQHTYLCVISSTLQPSPRPQYPPPYSKNLPSPLSQPQYKFMQDILYAKAFSTQYTPQIHAQCNNHYCIGHKEPRAASLPWKSEEMKLIKTCKIKGVNVRVNVMYNKYE